MAQDRLHTYRQAVDPGAVGAGVYWLDTSSEPFLSKIRNDSNTGWHDVGIRSSIGSAIAVTTNILTEVTDMLTQLNFDAPPFFVVESDPGLVSVGIPVGTYSDPTHNHDPDYSDILHNHDADYSDVTHTHDADYADIAHTHALVTYDGLYWDTLPGPRKVNSTDATAHASGVVGARAIGVCPAAATQYSCRFIVDTAVSGITWAEVAIASASSPTSGGLTLVPGTVENVAATFNSTGLVGVVFTPTNPFVPGTYYYVIHGSQATTPFKLRATLADEWSSGFIRTATARPSTMAAPTAFSTSSSAAYAAALVGRWIY